MAEITFVVDPSSGAIVVEDNQDLGAEAVEHLRTALGEPQEIGCARPLEIIEPSPAPVVSAGESARSVSRVRVAGYYHDSLTEGPGRRSSVLFQFCPLKCRGCYVPQLHARNAGSLIPVDKLANLLLDPNFERDGVTILGGEPFAQAPGLLALVRELRLKNCTHITCYSGYTLESLSKKAEREPVVSIVLEEIDILIDGAYVESLASSAGLWTGSGNQRVIDMRRTRAENRIVLYS